MVNVSYDSDVSYVLLHTLNIVLCAYLRFFLLILGAKLFISHQNAKYIVIYLAEILYNEKKHLYLQQTFNKIRIEILCCRKHLFC